MFDQQLLALARDDLARLKSSVEHIQSLVASEMPYEQLCKIANEKLLDIIEGESSGFLSLTIFESVGAAMPAFEKMLQLMEECDAISQSGG